MSDVIRSVVGIFLLGWGFISFAQSAIPPKEDSKAFGHARNIAKHIDNYQLDKAKETLNIALEEHPKSNSINYQLARYQLNLIGEKKEGLISFRYKDNEALSSTITTLKAIIDRDAKFGRAYSLLGHIYAVNGDYSQADTYLTVAESLKEDVVWLPYNRALYYIGVGDIDRAVGVLDESIKSKNKRRNPSQERYIRSLFGLRQSISDQYPQHEANSLIKNGKITRIAYQDLEATIKESENYAQPVFIHLSSEDGACRYCLNDNKIIDAVIGTEENYLSKNKNFRASINPWGDVGRYRDVLNKYYINGLPAKLIFNKGQLVSYYEGDFRHKNAAASFFKDADKAIKNKAYKRFSDATTAEEYGLLSYNIKLGVNSYTFKKGDKAIAVSVSSRGKSVYAIADEQSSTEDAVTMAMDVCEKRRSRSRIDQPCHIFAINDRFTYKQTSAVVTKVLATDFSDYKKRFRK